MYLNLLDLYFPSRFASNSRYDYVFYPTKDDKNLYKLELELPGVKKENVKVTVEDNKLKIKANKKGKDYESSVLLPKTLDSNSCQAKLEDGILSITMSAATPKQLKDVLVE